MIISNCEVSIHDQIESLRNLKPGWLNGSGEAIPRPGLDWVEGVLHRLIASGPVPIPYIYPTEDGNIQVEWSSLYIDPAADYMDLDVFFDVKNFTTDVWVNKNNPDSLEETKFDWLIHDVESRFFEFIKKNIVPNYLDYKKSECGCASCYLPDLEN